ncbi:galactose mutarotase-like protein [Flagelloscypha sp. PMI_526]|nr:galactose mutarotase-like protein [Flagelloscypha sp. PMI_526]
MGVAEAERRSWSIRSASCLRNRSYPLLSLALQANGADYPFDLTTLTAPDNSITAKFVSFGATMTELWVSDRHGLKRDVVLGYDDNSQLMTDPNHPVFSPIVGRYANRIKNGTFSIPISANPDPNAPNTYHIPTNDHDGQDTLHGGILGWDRRNWTIVAKTPTSVTYKHIDPADEGFPGTVTAYATHTVSNGGTLTTKVHCEASELTPIMLTQHIYWNLDAFLSSTGVPVTVEADRTMLNHTLKLDSSRVIEVDDLAIPTGTLINVTGTPFDFRKATQIGARWADTVDLCGSGCQGYDHDFVYDQDEQKKTGTTLWSDRSGIKVDISTNQPAVQVYTSFWMNQPAKKIHGGPALNYSRWSAVAIEQQGWIAAINTPQWGIDQIYGPDRDFDWSSTYKFSTIP